MLGYLKLGSKLIFVAFFCTQNFDLMFGHCPSEGRAGTKVLGFVLSVQHYRPKFVISATN